MTDDTAVVEETVRRAILPVVFGPEDRPLLGFYHAPDPTSTRALGFVFCNPLGYEAMSVHRTYRHLADRLAESGFPVLRFDYDGTGDSAGRSSDRGRVRAWLDGIKTAIAELGALTGTKRIGLFGVGFGATLATLAAAEHGDVECLIPWAPVVSGRAHVRELRAFRLVRNPRAPAPKRTDGSEEVGGYLFDRETLTDMSAIDLLAHPGRVAKRALVLPRSERPGEEARLVEHLKTQGVDVQVGSETGYARMMRDDPYETVVPFATLDRIVRFVSEGGYGETEAPPPAGSSRGVLTVTARDGKTTLRETPLLFGDAPQLFGILTEPEGGIRQGRPALCFLNVGANQHVGPHRMNVELARELASLGYLTFRFDVAGLGESRAAPAARENRIYTKDSVADVKTAMSFLGEHRNVQGFVLVGLCSGAYLAYHTSVVDSRVTGLVQLSPYAFEWNEGDSLAPVMRKTIHSTRFYARALLDRKTWARILKGDVNVRGIAQILLERFKTQVDEGLPAMTARLRGQIGPKNDVERAFTAMCERGVESLMVLSFEDGGVDMIARYLGNDARKMRGHENFSLQILDGADHTFQAISSQNRLREVLTSYVKDCFP